MAATAWAAAAWEMAEAASWATTAAAVAAWVTKARVAAQEMVAVPPGQAGSETAEAEVRSPAST